VYKWVVVYFLESERRHAFFDSKINMLKGAEKVKKEGATAIYYGKMKKYEGELNNG
jgi:hypothetical protein